jgi:uncharacterized protein involved in response to NO
VTYIKDLAERVLATYALTFLGLLLAAGYDWTDVSALKSAALAAVPAALQLVYSALAKFVGDPSSAGVVRQDRNL